MRTRWGLVCAAALLAACDSGPATSGPAPKEEPALVPVDIEITRSYKFRELARARHDLKMLRAPGGSDYARQWGMTREEGIAQVQQAIWFWSQNLGPVPEVPDGAPEVLPGELGPLEARALEEEGHTCWWYAYQRDADDGGWWVCELAEH